VLTQICNKSDILVLRWNLLASLGSRQKRSWLNSESWTFSIFTFF